MVEKFTAAVLQMNSAASLDENLAFVEDQLELARRQKVELLVLPENFAQIPASSAERHIETGTGGVVQSFLAEASERFCITIVAGSIPVREESRQKPFARCIVFSEGQAIAAYDKIHLFDVELPGGARIRESDVYRAGSPQAENIVVAETKYAGLGLSICYDLRFPELYRKLVDQGARILLVPAAFTRQTGRAHWQTLLQARAIENQCYVMAAAQTGVHADQRECWGHSMIVDPWGEIIAQKNTEPGLLSCQIDLTKLTDIQAAFPALKHRRLQRPR